MNENEKKVLDELKWCNWHKGFAPINQWKGNYRVCEPCRLRMKTKKREKRPAPVIVEDKKEENVQE